MENLLSITKSVAKHNLKTVRFSGFNDIIQFQSLRFILLLDCHPKGIQFLFFENLKIK